MEVLLPVPSSALRLRPWRPDDLAALVEAHRDPVLRRWLTTSLTGEAEAREWLDAQSAGWAAVTRFSFAVVAGDTLMGHVVVKTGTAEVGYWTAAHARGQGIAVRALDTAAHWALHTQDTVAITRLGLVHAAANAASCRVAVKCGFAFRELLPAAPPAFPGEGHRHERTG
ncbi:GNAT family N-acetyltransferase [Lentzea sp. NPDC060358]|uniref:GNAT family N-acetyltransferase n=1 Tax=Lentzea sp. NPDC060358 TaxID=3347103 RepID=UPI003666A8CA